MEEGEGALTGVEKGVLTEMEEGVITGVEEREGVLTGVDKYEKKLPVEGTEKRLPIALCCLVTVQSGFFRGSNRFFTEDTFTCRFK